MTHIEKQFIDLLTDINFPRTRVCSVLMRYGIRIMVREQGDDLRHLKRLLKTLDFLHSEDMVNTIENVYNKNKLKGGEK